MKFQPHTRRWFLSRIGKEIRKVYLSATPEKVKTEPTPLTVKIASPVHAESLYQWHKDNRVNIIEA
jgi:hypothetical protein